MLVGWAVVESGGSPFFKHYFLTMHFLDFINTDYYRQFYTMAQKEPMPYNDEQAPVKFSFIIHAPSADLDPTGKVQVHITMAVRSIAQIAECGVYVPAHVLNFLNDAFALGAHRVEILHGDIEYKMYVKPQ